MIPYWQMEIYVVTATRRGQLKCCEVMRHPSGWVQTLSRALWWRREVSPQESPLPPPQPPTRGSELGGGPCPPFVQRKAKPGPHFSFHSPSCSSSVWKQFLWDQHQSLNKKLMFHDVWAECGVSVSILSSVKIFSLFLIQNRKAYIQVNTEKIQNWFSENVHSWKIQNNQGSVFVRFGLDQGNAAMNNYAKFKRNY